MVLGYMSPSFVPYHSPYSSRNYTKPNNSSSSSENIRLLCPPLVILTPYREEVQIVRVEGND